MPRELFPLLDGIQFNAMHRALSLSSFPDSRLLIPFSTSSASSCSSSQSIQTDPRNSRSSPTHYVLARIPRRNQAVPYDCNIIPGGDDRQTHVLGRKFGPILSGTAYCILSCSMILLNKIVLSSYNFNAGISLMFYQNLIATTVVLLLGFSVVVSLERLNWKLIKVWSPVNVIFVGMLVSGMFSLKYINIAMVTILKNVTNILTAIGELYVFRKHQNQKVWIAMFLMIISAISSGITLLLISLSTWKLTLRRVMEKAKQCTNSGCLNEVSMVLLNNLLSQPFALLLILLFEEWKYAIQVDVTKTPMFWVVATASGFLGLAISFTSMWFLHQTGPTTYSLVGSLNKIPISVAGLLLFHVPLQCYQSLLFSILFGLFAGVFFANAKMSDALTVGGCLWGLQADGLNKNQANIIYLLLRA